MSISLDAKGAAFLIPFLGPIIGLERAPFQNVSRIHQEAVKTATEWFNYYLKHRNDTYNKCNIESVNDGISVQRSRLKEVRMHAACRGVGNLLSIAASLALYSLKIFSQPVCIAASIGFGALSIVEILTVKKSTTALEAFDQHVNSNYPHQ